MDKTQELTDLQKAQLDPYWSSVINLANSYYGGLIGCLNDNDFFELYKFYTDPEADRRTIKGNFKAYCFRMISGKIPESERSQLKQLLHKR